MSQLLKVVGLVSRRVEMVKGIAVSAIMLTNHTHYPPVPLSEQIT